MWPKVGIDYSSTTVNRMVTEDFRRTYRVLPITEVLSRIKRWLSYETRNYDKVSERSREKSDFTKWTP